MWSRCNTALFGTFLILCGIGYIVGAGLHDASWVSSYVPGAIAIVWGGIAVHDTVTTENWVDSDATSDSKRRRLEAPVLQCHLPAIVSPPSAEPHVHPTIAVLL